MLQNHTHSHCSKQVDLQVLLLIRSAGMAFHRSVLVSGQGRRAGEQKLNRTYMAVLEEVFASCNYGEWVAKSSFSTFQSKT